MLSSVVASPAQASFCRNLPAEAGSLQDNHDICILSIKRSAKNYWEYRVVVSIDRLTRPVEVYNCRDRILVGKARIVPFQPNGAGELICRFFQK